MEGKYVSTGMFINSKGNKSSGFEKVSGKGDDNLAFKYDSKYFIGNIYNITETEDGMYRIKNIDEFYKGDEKLSEWRSNQWSNDQKYRAKQAEKKADKLDIDNRTVKQIKEECKKNWRFKEGVRIYFNNF